jgi:hypothetical protein
MKQALLFCCVFTISSIAAAGSMYRWKDAEGNVHFTQKPPPPSAESVDKTEIKGKNAVKSNWSARMQSNARGFMDKAGVQRVWVDRNGKEVESQNRY